MEQALSLGCHDVAAIRHLMRGRTVSIRPTACEPSRSAFCARYERPMPVMSGYDQLLAGPAEVHGMKAAAENLEQAAVRTTVSVPYGCRRWRNSAPHWRMKRPSSGRPICVISKRCLLRSWRSASATLIARRIKDARLPRMKTLEEFDFSKAPQVPATQDP